MIISIYLIIATAIVLADPPKIVLASDYRCPYTCNPADKNPGYLVEVAQRIFEIYGIQIEYKLMPWSEALRAADEGKIDGIIGISTIADKNLIIPHTPQALTDTSVFGRAGIDWTYDEPGSLTGKKIAMVLDYTLNDNIQQYITTNYLQDPWSFVVENGVHAVTDSIDAVVNNRADVFIGYQDVVERYLESADLYQKIENYGAVNTEPIPLYISFSGSIARGQEYIKMLEDGMVSLSVTGDLDYLRTKYKITQ